MAPGLRDALFLTKNGVPFETAMRMSPARRLALTVIFGELDGGRWNWKTLAWERDQNA